MRARCYNPDIKRFINQNIKVGDIGSSQSLNRYAYCEGNPVSMVDPFGLCGEDANDQGQKSKYQWLHNALDVVGLFFDVADVVNAAVYAMEGDWTNAAICAACAIPAVGAAVIGVAKTAKAVIKAKKAEKIASLAAEAAKMTKNAANTLDTFSDTMKAVSKWGDNPLKLADGITAEAGSKAMKALETGGDFAKESQKAVWEMKAVVGADGIRLSTKADEGASLLKHGFAGTDGVAKSAGKGSKKSLKIQQLPLAKPGEDLYVGTYNKSKYWNRKTGLNKTHSPHHAVQDAVSKTSTGRGITINIRRDIHLNTKSYGTMRSLSSNRQHLAADIAELKVLLKEQGYDRSTINAQLYELIKQNKAIGGFNK